MSKQSTQIISNPEVIITKGFQQSYSPKEYDVVDVVGINKHGTEDYLVAIKKELQIGVSANQKTLFHTYVQGCLSTDGKTFYSHTKHRICLKVFHEHSDIDRISNPELVPYGVYLIECIYANGTYLKIGMSENVNNRFIGIESANPFATCIGYIKNKHYKKLEKQLHQQFNTFRVKGEWFTADDSIYEFFKSHPEFKEL